jgi:hypothetical protein
MPWRVQWVEEKAQTWADGVLEPSKVVGRHPQAARAGLQKSLQQEWQFLQRVTNRLSNEFEVVEEALATKLLPSLFGNGESCDTKRQLVCLPVKHAGLALPNPMTAVESNWKASTLICDTWSPLFAVQQISDRKITQQQCKAERQS